jgi:hypothetical protein
LPTDPINDVDAAIAALQHLSAGADRDTILATVNQRLTVERDVRSAEMVMDARDATLAPRQRSWWYEWIGCLFPIILIPALFMAMPLLFSLGERIVSRPARTTATGIIERIEYNDGTTDDTLGGKQCRITSFHVMVDAPDKTRLIIPNEAYRKITLKSEAD